MATTTDSPDPQLEELRNKIALMCLEGLPATSDNKAKLMELIKKGFEDERTELLANMKTLTERASAAEAAVLLLQAQVGTLTERASAAEAAVLLLQAQLKASETERLRLEESLEETNRRAQKRVIELGSLDTILAKARATVMGLEMLKEPSAPSKK